MTLKDLLIQELDNVADPLIIEVLDFLRFLKTKQTQDCLNLIENRTRLASTGSSTLLDYPLQGQEPYCYEDPFAPAAPIEEWEVLQ